MKESEVNRTLNTQYMRNFDCTHQSFVLLALCINYFTFFFKY